MAVHKISEQFHCDLNIDWPCPRCHQKTLQIIKDSFIVEKSAETRKYENEDWFEVEMNRLVFTCMAECTKPQCNEVVACSGIGGANTFWDTEYGEHQKKWYRPKSFTPALHPFRIPEQCMEEISKPLTASFYIYLSQPGSAANLIRITVERMLTAIGIPELNNKRRIPLHNRINGLEGQYVSYKDYLMAIKFLGNAGSHTYDEVEIGDIEVAFEIMEFVLNDLFSAKKASIDELSKHLQEKFEKKKIE
ncbi:TPA: DUF4145 domain-containing protein [Proteus mirabilis]|uniref:DUF4145 domain-containing protein n=2 Tax=Morganellaceae TaxID=1903414 RepID=A0AAI9HU10_MORMO|nr:MULTISPECIES: DUF4145 domain-containing protein [Providencia]EJV1663868.1 DUF4145 domain-containing protein [Klebsiella pneumoniae]EKW8761655.1 DUF4145 domain-containing protein [Morganella morganii]HEJ9425122.1 DUF4145 domain-containing protein [Proteus mirabilis]ELI9034826.1 DUF4145 domain-containing protein [Morganella morganii]MBX6949220.1 DUF4145 domain-containing protein [Providencia rettgeri]